MNVTERVRQTNTSARLVVRCLGRFRVETSSGDQLHVRTRKSRAVLAALALTGRPMSREELADLLWSDRGPVQAKSSLRQAIFELQHFEFGGSPILVVGRDDLAVHRDHLVTDVELVRAAATEGDWARLFAMLAGSEPGLLTDLDGLDAEFDDWLRQQRAQEPARTLVATVGAAERCRAEAGPRAALDLVSEILRLDPVNEEATRLALEIDHELGDNRALNNHYQSLARRLRDDYDAEPSAETLELFRRLSDGAAPRDQAAEAAATAAPRLDVRYSGPGVVVLSLILVGALALLALLFTRERQAAAATDETILIAVLPFDQLPAGDRFLADGIGEQTRLALSRNGYFQVLGRVTTNTLAEQKLPAQQYLRRLGVTHLLEGTVRNNGEQVLVSISLSRTSDGITVWQDMFRGRMHEPFGLQGAIANGIEGKLRGRLASGGGRRAEQIATTPEVYGLYSEARQLIASRQRENFRRAEALLRQAVKTDPNFGPAWSLLGAAIFFNGRIAIVDSEARAEAVASVNRALSLAPNFAPAHATLAIIEGEGSVAAEQALRRAVALDPSYSEAWNWLGNALHSQHRQREALAAYERAVAIDPLLQPAVQNLALTANALQDQTALNRLMRTITRAGASALLIGSIRADQLYSQGDYSGAIKILRGLGLRADGRAPPALWQNWFDALTGIGNFDALHGVTRCPEWYAPLLAGDGLPPRTFEGRTVLPEEFWTSFFFSSPAARALVNHGRSEKLVRLYRDGFDDADGFISSAKGRDMLAELAPSVAHALRTNGSAEEASYILSVASTELEVRYSRSPDRLISAQLAAIRSMQGERAQALALLDRASSKGWLPDGRAIALDLAQEPAFRELRGDPRFETVRRRILAHIAKERAELEPPKV